MAAIKVMEDSPLFNASKEAVFTNEGKNGGRLYYGRPHTAATLWRGDGGITTIKKHHGGLCSNDAFDVL